jgi:hypothetical protein
MSVDGMLEKAKLPMQSKRAFLIGLIILNMSDFASYSLWRTLSYTS